MGHIFGLGLGRDQHIGQGVELGLKPPERLQGLDGAGQLAQSAAVLIAFKQQRALVGPVDQGLCVGQPTVLGAELLPLVRLRVELFQLTNLPGQPLAFVGQGALRLLRIGQALLGLPPSVPSGFERPCVDACVRVEQAAHRVRSGQALPSVLAVDVEELLAQLAQLCGGGGAAVDPGAAFSGGVYSAAQQQVGAGLKACFFDPGRNGGSGLELGTHLATAGAFAHHARFGTGPQSQLQSVDQNRFARPGLARQHTEA